MSYTKMKTLIKLDVLFLWLQPQIMPYIIDVLQAQIEHNIDSKVFVGTF